MPEILGGSMVWFIKEDLVHNQKGRGRHYASRSQFHLYGWTADQYKVHKVIDLDYHNSEVKRLEEEIIRLKEPKKESPDVVPEIR